MDIRSIRTLACVGLAVLGAVLATPAAAATVTGTYVGIVTNVETPVDSQIHVNDPFSFTFSYDDTTPDSDPGEPFVGEYYSNTMSAHGTIGSFAFSAGGGSNDSIGVVTASQFGFNFMSPITGNAIGGFSLTDINVDLNHMINFPLNDALPSSYLAASLFRDGSFTFDFSEERSGFLFVSEMTGTINVAATPIPGALPLFASALAGLGFLARRRRSRVPG
jgi:hypothetical protein